MSIDINSIFKIPRVLGINSFKSALWFFFLGFVSNFFVSNNTLINWCVNLNWCHIESYDFFPLPLDLIKIIVWIVLFLKIRQLIILLQPYFHFSLLKFAKHFKKDWYSYPEIVFNGDENNRKRFFQEWNIQGYPVLDKQGLVFTNSEAGCLISPKFFGIWKFRFFWYGRVWKNFKAILKVNFRKQYLEGKLNEGQKKIGNEYIYI